MKLHRSHLFVCCLLVFSGCGPKASGRPGTVPVEGLVTYNGQPMTKGTVEFIPTDPKQPRPAYGEIAGDGKYVLNTFGKNDGAISGDYRVAVRAYDGADPDKKVEGKKTLPEKFYRASTSGLTASVPKDTKGTVKIDLKLEGK